MHAVGDDGAHGFIGKVGWLKGVFGVVDTLVAVAPAVAVAVADVLLLMLLMLLDGCNVRCRNTRFCPDECFLISHPERLIVAQRHARLYVMYV